MSSFFSQVFSWVCGQELAHTWAPGGEFLPLCQRCMGLYAGAALGFILLLSFRPRIDARYRWIHSALVLAMIPFGYHLVPHGAFVRTLSGQWFGFGVAGLLWPLAARGCALDEARSSGFRSYGIWALASVLVLPAFACYGGKIAGLLLQWVAFLGLAVLAVLFVLDFFLLCLSLAQRAVKIRER